MVSRLTLYCDRCDMEERSVEGTAWRLGLDDNWYEVHLCEQCRKEFAAMPLDEVLGFVRDHGETIGGRPVGAVDDGQMPCLWCDKTYGSIGGLEGHLKTRHRIATPEEAWGQRCPACGSQDFSRLGTHASRTHHRHVSVLMQEAILAGDPYGVVKERLRAHRR